MEFILVATLIAITVVILTISGIAAAGLSLAHHLERDSRSSAVFGTSALGLHALALAFMFVLGKAFA